MDLREEPSNIKLLLSVISMIYENHQEMESKQQEIKDFDIVNYVLANALKSDQIDPQDLGIVLTYLEVVHAPSIYWQYAILRVH
jgi:hypothetical protein